MKKVLFLIAIIILSANCLAQTKDIEQIEKQAKITQITTYSLATVSTVSLITSFIVYDKISEKKIIPPDFSNFNTPEKQALKQAEYIERESKKNMDKAKRSRLGLQIVAGISAIGTVVAAFRYIDLKHEIVINRMKLQAGIMDSGNVGLAINF